MNIWFQFGKAKFFNLFKNQENFDYKVDDVKLKYIYNNIFISWNKLTLDIEIALLFIKNWINIFLF
jgi:hypothetical protein